MTAPASPSLAQIEALLADHGGSDLDYLRHHWQRFVETRRRIQVSRPLPPGALVLDIGAHWLHQSVLYALGGQRVIALDLPASLTAAEVQSLARALAIELIVEPELERAAALAALPTDSVDLVLCTELIEHIAFNPVALWRAIHRVLKPGGRIVMTTPNYYALRGRAWGLGRFLRGGGGGLDVRALLGLHSHSHHWKEYSARELMQYFRLLSPDFQLRRCDYVEEHAPLAMSSTAGRLARRVETLLPPLRPSLYLEIELGHKHHGITIAPGW